MQEVIIREVLKEEVSTLRTLAQSTFEEAFGMQNDARDMEDYVANKFTLDQVTKEFNHPHSLFYFSVMDDQVVGYLKINWGDAQTEPLIGNALEVERIYIVAAFQQMKVGQKLFDFAIEFAQTHDFKTVWLGVWDQNVRAIKFYEKNGFKVFDSHNFYLGSDKQTDLLMRLDLAND